MQSVTVHLPDTLYQRIRRRARERNRSVEDEVIKVVEQSVTTAAPSTAELLEQLPHLADDDLWRAARLRVADDRAEHMQWLVWKQQGEGLTAAEEDEAQQLQQHAQQVMLIRAEAAALLAERGFDVAPLLDSPTE